MSALPDAWDDDWSNVADKGMVKPQQTPQIVSRAERKARHAEANRQLWEAAERPEREYFLESKNEVPLKDDFKPQLKVLSRKPQAAPKVMSRGAPNGMAGLSIQDDEDSEEEERRSAAATLAERQRRAAIEREEKQRKYAEVRERLFGPSSSVQNPDGASRGIVGKDSRQLSRRGRGGSGRGSHAGSSAEQSPARNGAAKQLFDPSSSAKSRGPEIMRSSTPKGEQPIRQPRGPDSGGRGGFGFAPRGGRPTV